MKKVVTLILISTAFFGCKNTKEERLPTFDDHGRRILYSVEDYYKYKFQKDEANTVAIDTFCISQKQRAKNDILKNNLLYVITPRPEENILKNMLTKLGFATRIQSFSDIRHEGFEPFCYEEIMSEEIKKQFGANFKDSIELEARKQFIRKNPTFPYFEDGVDLREKYLNE